ncbi:lipopolysaccharide biosynthesis protein [Nocardioides sp.]|uniref:lipopolysaccharide biosynthesis protein n=1 Tax=Nocardioides sp. TaxID=35761 RepID=UPI002D7F94B5|nr:oligosaccharide flippase family protein [Nocardioides sp.]HET8962012.1 oligosaccharide flippase family protein [Nocardioides sp.]
MIQSHSPAPGSLRGLLRSGVGIAVATGIMNLTTYGFVLAAARLLGPAEYGGVARLMFILLVVGVLSLGLQATGARKIAATPSRREEVEAAVMSASYRSALALGALCLLLTPVIVWTARLDSWPSALMIGLSVVPLTIMGGQSGILQGERRWGPLAGIYLGMGVGRFVLGGAMMLLIPTAFGAMLGVTLGACVPAVVGAVALGHVGRGRAPGEPTVVDPEQVLHEVVANSHALLAFFALSGVDVLVAGLVLDEHAAGLYAAGLILTKAVLFLPQVVVIVAFPSMASSTERHRVYLKGLALVAAAGVCATLGAIVFSDLAIAFVGGDQYSAIEPYVGLFATLGMVLAMIQLMVYEVVARQHRASVLVLWAGLVGVASTALYVDSVGSLVLSVTVVNLLVLLTLVVDAMRHRPETAVAAG